MSLKYYFFFFSFLLTSILLPNPLLAVCDKPTMCNHFEGKFDGTPADACDANLECAATDDEKELCRHYFHQVKTFKGPAATSESCQLIPVPELIPKGNHRIRQSVVYIFTSKYGDDLLTDDQLTAAWTATRDFTFPQSMCNTALGARKDRLIANEHNELETMVSADVRLVAIPKTLYEILLLATTGYFTKPPNHPAGHANPGAAPNRNLFQPTIKSPDNVCEGWAENTNYFKTKLQHADTSAMAIAANKAILIRLMKQIKGAVTGEGNVDHYKSAARKALLRYTTASSSTSYKKAWHGIKAGNRRHIEILSMLGHEYSETATTGFMMYRAAEKSKITTEAAYFGGNEASLSWGASLFGGWYFDGPSLGGEKRLHSALSYVS